jgi:FkbM family methyltransferase
MQYKIIIIVFSLLLFSLLLLIETNKVDSYYKKENVTNNKRKYFIDLGTNMFQGLLEFTQKLRLNKSWNVYSYEGNKDIFIKSLEIKDHIKNKYNTLNHFNYGVIDYNGTIKFNQHKGSWVEGKYLNDYNEGSNLLPENPKYDPGNGAIFDIEYEEIQCVDINDIIKKIISEDVNAEIYIKSDIEGSEFRVLQRLLESEYISHIKTLYVEWHERFWIQYGTDEYTKKCLEKKYILDRFNQLNIPCYVHH